MQTHTLKNYEEYYGHGGKPKRALFRLSVWEASGRECYMCDRQLVLREVELDHVIPKSLPKSEFDALWAAHAPRQPNNGKNHVTNIRAACSKCNSGRMKGSKLLSAINLNTILMKSPDFEKAVRKFQDAILRLGPYAQAAVLVADVQSPDDIDTLMTPTITEALLDALGSAATRRTKGAVRPSPLQFDLAIADRAQVTVFLTEQHHRSLLAGQLLSGWGLSDALPEVMRQVRLSVWLGVESEYIEGMPPHLAASAGEPEWGFGTFEVRITAVELDSDGMSCHFSFSCRIEQTVDFSVATQSDDGGHVEDHSDELTTEAVVTGTAMVDASGVTVDCDETHVFSDLN